MDIFGKFTPRELAQFCYARGCTATIDGDQMVAVFWRGCTRLGFGLLV